jgi:hypothetical protein
MVLTTGMSANAGTTDSIFPFLIERQAGPADHIPQKPFTIG